MELKEFQIDVPGQGTVDVNFVLHFVDNVVSVSDVKIHSDFDSGLPHRPHLVFHDGSWQFHVDHPVMKDKEVVVEEEFLSNDLSKEIIDRILRIKEDAKAR